MLGPSSSEDVWVDIAGVVLAAGFGTRLRPLTDLFPKALCPVGNVALVDLALDRLADVGVADLAVNVHHGRDQMFTHLAGRQVHVSVEEPEVLGTAGALGQLRRWLDDRPAVVHNADAWFDADLRSFVADWDGERIRLLAVPVRDGVAPDFDGCTFAGVSAMPAGVLSALRPEPSGLWEVSWRLAMDEGRIEVVVHDGEWYDTGTPADYLSANLAAAGGCSVVAADAIVEPGAVVERCVVWSGARVQAGEHLVEQIRAPGPITVDGRR